MPKTTFSKSQFLDIHRILMREKMLPCDKIGCYYDVFNSGKVLYSIIRFVKGEKQLDIGFVTKTVPKVDKLEKQLYEYFGGK